MGFFSRWRAPEVDVGMDVGFWVAEAAVMQRTIMSLLPRRAAGTVPAHLEFAAGAEGRVAVQWHNRLIGFVPPSHEEMIRRQLAVAGSVRLVTDGEARTHGRLWRIWAGPTLPADAGPPPAPIDEIPPEPTRIFGIPMSTSPTPSSRRPARTTPAARRVLVVDHQSWEVRDGTDIDLTLLRRRIAAAEPGARLHLRVWDETVMIDLRPETRVTLTDPDTGDVEVLHPRGADRP